MIIDEIKLRNFRQFYGDQTIECASEKKKNVTLIHAENGVGKTTILNAVMWAFYGETTDRFEQSNDIINYEAIKENKKSATVEVSFSNKESDYVVQRHHSIDGNGRQSQKFAAFNLDDNGVLNGIRAAETFVNSVLPVGMAPYFFFDGEHAEAFAAAGNQKAVSSAIRSILGCDIAEIAIDDLKKISKDYLSEMGHVPGQDSLQQTERELQNLQNENDKDEKSLKELEKSAEQIQTQMEGIIAKLRDSEDAKHLQKRRDDLDQFLNTVNTDLKAAEEDKLRWVATKTLPLVSKKLANQTLDFIDEESLKGRLPAPYHEEFVQGLLSAETCCCERPLKPGTPEYKAIQALIHDASNAEILGRVVRARTRVEMLREQAEDAPKRLKHSQDQIASLVQKRMGLEQEIAEVSKKLEDLPVEEIAQRERARKQLQSKFSEIHTQIGGINESIRRRKNQIAEKERMLEALARKNTRARGFQMRRDVSNQAAGMLKAFLDKFESDARELIQGEINKILEKTARRDYRFRFDEKFAMELLFADGRPVPRSGGENQLMSLAFTAALVNFAALRAGASGEILTPGTIAPLVLDSPFGQLDKTYRIATAEFVPQMARQVILLVSSSQGDDSVLQALEPHIGAEYLLISENRGPRGEKTEDKLILRNKEFKASLFNQERNLTRIERIR